MRKGREKIVKLEDRLETDPSRGGGAARRHRRGAVPRVAGSFPPRRNPFHATIGFPFSAGFASSVCRSVLTLGTGTGTGTHARRGEQPVLLVALPLSRSSSL